MGTETQDPGSQPKPTPPGVLPPDEGQDVPKTGRDPSDPLDQDAADDDVPGEDDGDEGDEDETGKIELPGATGQGDQRDPSIPPA